MVAAIALQLAGSGAGTVDTVYARPPLDRHDDAHAYMVFPRAMLELGSIGPQPWEARRMLSLGAQSGLQTLLLVAMPVRAVHLLDAGLGVVHLLGLVLGAARHRAVGGPATALVAAVVLTTPHVAMRGNTSAVLTGAVLLLALFRLLEEDDSGSPGVPGGTALVTAAIIAAKSTLAPAAVGVAVVGLLAPALERRRWRPTAIAALAAGAATVLLLLPWMISVLESSGTLLYPIFGKGFYGGVYDVFAWAEGTFEVPLAARAAALARHGVVLLPVLVLLAAADDRRPRRAATALATGAVATLVALVLMGDPSLNRGIERYAYPANLAATLGLLLAALTPTSETRRRLGPALGVAVAAVLILGNPEAVRDLYGQLVRNVKVATTAPAAATDEEQAAAQAIQAALPADETVLATLEHPWLLEPGSVRLRILSLPGMASPPPGLPLDRGPEELAQTLTRQGVRFLAYGGRRDLADLLQLEAKDIRERYPGSKTRWIMLRGHERYRRLVDDLAASRKRRYSDGRRVVLDLAVPASTVVPRESPERCTGFLPGGWTTGDAMIHGLRAPSTPAWVVLRTDRRHPAWRAPDAAGLVVSVNGRPLPAADHLADALVLRLDDPPAGAFDLRVVSTALPASEVGARPTSPPLGVDVTAVEVVTDPVIAAMPMRTLRQPIVGELEPERVWRRQGFYPDFGWTDGDGRLEGLEWQVAPDDRELELELHPVHPQADHPELLDLHVVVDGLDLVPLDIEPRIARFRLPPKLDTIRSVEILSSTFVPREQGRSDDGRTLGVPVQRLTLRGR
jgi:hypothetical protein